MEHSRLWNGSMSRSLAAAVSLIVVAVLVITFFHDAKIVSVAGGLVGGLAVYSAAAIAERHRYAELDGYRAMRVKTVLPNHLDRKYYGELLAGAQKRVQVMGTSCSHFIEDFLNPKSDNKVLVDALAKNPKLCVQLMVPTEENMGWEAKQRFELVRDSLALLRQEFGEDGRFEIRRFEHAASHSMVIVDDDLVAGPVFEGDTGPYAPAIHIDATTQFGTKYLAYFRSQWEKAT